METIDNKYPISIIIIIIIINSYILQREFKFNYE